MTKAQEIIHEAALKYPTISSRALARLCYKSSPEFWRNLDGCLMAVRFMRGAMGNKNRKAQSAESVLPASKCKSNNPFQDLPEGKTQFEKWESLLIEGPARALI